jgi:hypothetical protein
MWALLLVFCMASGAICRLRSGGRLEGRTVVLEWTAEPAADFFKFVVGRKTNLTAPWETVCYLPWRAGTNRLVLTNQPGDGCFYRVGRTP